MHQSTRFLAVVLLVSQVFAGVFLPAAGQEAATPATGPALAAEKAKEDVLREQTIYIPYDKLRETFEKEGRGVFLPYEKFQELWNAARAQTQAAEPPRRPVDALIQGIENVATIGEEVVQVAATLDLEILGEGWVKIPLRLRNSAILSATIDGQPARVVFDESVGHQLLYQKAGTDSQRLSLKLEYARSFTKSPGQSSVAFEAPQAPINRWRIRVPEAGMSLQIEPMIAATRSEEAAPDDAAASAELLAFVGTAPEVRLTWNPKAEGASGLAAFATVQAEQQIVISEGVARSTVQLDYDISRSTLTQLVVEVPADQKVVNVVDRNVKRWNVENTETEEAGQAAGQVIRVELFEATQGRQSLLIELEQFSDATSASYNVPAALVRAVGVGRQQGVVVARLEEGLQAEAVTRTGLLQLDQNDLPARLRDTSWTFAYRYGTVPYELTLHIEKVLPRISVTELIDAELATDRITLNWQGLYQIEDAGVFQLRLKLPSEFEVRSVEGKAIGDAQPVAVDSYHRVEAEGTTWIVNLARSALGRVGLSVTLQRTLDEPNLLAPTGKAATLPIPLPHPLAEDVQFSQGTLVLSAPPSLRVNPAETLGLRSISFEEAYQQIPAAPRTSPQLQPVLPYAFAKGDTRFSVTAERRKPQVTVDQLLQVEIDSGVVKYHAAFYFDVKYSGVKALRVDVPSELTAEIRATDKSMRREQLTPQPEDVPDGYTAWSFAAETELLGTVELNLVWEQKIDELGVGKSQEITVPRLIPQGTDLATGQIVIRKSESIDVTKGVLDGLIAIDPHTDLRRETKVDDAAMAFAFVSDWSLQFTATRYQPQTSKATSVELGVVRVVALSQGELSVQALYRIRSAQQRLAIGLAENVTFDAQPLRINGKPVAAERKSETEISAPLSEQSLDETFVLELRYTLPGTPAEISLPTFSDDPAVQKVYLCVYLPDKQALLASSGPWSNESLGTTRSLLDPSPAPDVVELLQRVTESNESAMQAARTFPTGKSTPVVYSTLRPEAPPRGALCLSTMHRRLFDALILLVLVVAGLPLLRRSLRAQLCWLLLASAVVLLVGVFLPELAWTLVASIFFPAVALLIILWLVGHVTRLRVHRAAAQPTEPSPAGESSHAQDLEVAEAVDLSVEDIESSGADQAPEAESPPDVEITDKQPEDPTNKNKQGGSQDA